MTMLRLALIGLMYPGAFAFPKCWNTPPRITVPGWPTGATAPENPTKLPLPPSMTAPARRSSFGNLSAVQIMPESRYRPAAKQNVDLGALLLMSVCRFDVGLTCTPWQVDEVGAGDVLGAGT